MLPWCPAVKKALACPPALVASRVDALQEVIENGETGRLFIPEDATALANNLMRLLVSPELREELAAAAMRHVQTTYGRQAFVEILGNILGEIVVTSELGR